ncbi:MAG: GNAT family N-acetyltransferase [Lachnospiraceae bacterium]|nr:GNAT family N-acetyltransferase [Lachnospiraceae bacterium]
MKSRVDVAEALFREGYNCSQAVFGAHGDLYGLERDMAMRLAASFGGGMGRMREVCGTLSGTFLIAGMETGATEGKDAAGKKRNYDMVQQLAGVYRAENGSIICRELLGLDKNGQKADTSVTTPDARTEEYYRKRPCIQLIRRAAAMAEEMLLYRYFSCDTAEFVRVETEEQLAELATIANEVWHQHFATILSPEQIDYMVDKFQSEHAMREQMENQSYEYYFIHANGVNVGYVGIKPDGDRLFLSKLYILQRYRGNGYASGAFEFMRRLAKVRGLRAVWLTVNRYNADTIAIYKKKGFVVTEEKVTDIGNGFVMDDYFMEWQI